MEKRSKKRLFVLRGAGVCETVNSGSWECKIQKGQVGRIADNRLECSYRTAIVSLSQP